MIHAKPLPLRKQQKNYTRQRLVEVARELFAKKGVQDTGIEDIAKAAGTSRATVYTHFGGKNEIIREMVAEIWENSQALCEEFGALKDWSRPTIREWIGHVFEESAKVEEGTRMMMREAPSTVLNETWARMNDQVAALMANTALWAHFSAEEGRRRAFLLNLQLFRCVWLYQIEILETDGKLLFDTLTDVWRATLHADQGATSKA